MVGTQLGNGAGETTLPFGHVVGDIWYEIGEGSVRFAHDAILIIAEIGSFQPERTIELIGVACFHEVCDCLFNQSIGVQRGLEVINVKLHVERLEVQILFMP